MGCWGVWEEGGREGEGEEVGVWPGVSEDYLEEGGRYDRMLAEEEGGGGNVMRRG